MKANVQISAVKKEFKNGQQGWQVFVEGMEGKLRCEMNFRDALRAIRYSFLLAKKLNLRINEVQLAALSLDYKQNRVSPPMKSRRLLKRWPLVIRLSSSSSAI